MSTWKLQRVFFETFFGKHIVVHVSIFYVGDRAPSIPFHRFAYVAPLPRQVQYNLMAAVSSHDTPVVNSIVPT